MNFDIEQLKRDNGQCLYCGEPAYAVVMPSHRIVVEYYHAGFLRFTDTPRLENLRNIPRKHRVQLWRGKSSGKVMASTGPFSEEPFLSGDWERIAVGEIEEGQGL